MIGDSAVTSISDRLTDASIRSRFSSVSSIEKARILSHMSPRMRVECSTLLMMMGRMALSSKFP